MAAEIIEEVVPSLDDANDLPPEENVQTPEQVIASFEAPDTVSVDTTVDDDLPEKYRGKSVKDVVAMHQEAEKVIGRQGGEVGELRQVVDGFIKSKLQDNTQQQTQEEEVDFFEDPEKAVSKAIATHPAVQQAQQDSMAYRQQTAMGALKEKHPDMQKVLQDPKFGEWVKASPVRVELFQRADTQFDFNCADELITQYKERSASVNQAVQAEQTARKQQVQAASTGSTSGANTAGSKRIYRRADIIRLMKTDPDRYEALSPEIMQAYAEGRVR